MAGIVHLKEAQTQSSSLVDTIISKFLTDRWAERDAVRQALLEGSVMEVPESVAKRSIAKRQAGQLTEKEQRNPVIEYGGMYIQKTIKPDVVRSEDGTVTTYDENTGETLSVDKSNKKINIWQFGEDKKTGIKLLKRRKITLKNYYDKGYAEDNSWHRADSLDILKGEKKTGGTTKNIKLTFWTAEEDGTYKKRIALVPEDKFNYTIDMIENIGGVLEKPEELTPIYHVTAPEKPIYVTSMESERLLKTGDYLAEKGTTRIPNKYYSTIDTELDDYKEYNLISDREARSVRKLAHRIMESQEKPNPYIAFEEAVGVFEEREDVISEIPNVTKLFVTRSKETKDETIDGVSILMKNHGMTVTEIDSLLRRKGWKTKDERKEIIEEAKSAIPVEEKEAVTKSRGTSEEYLKSIGR